MAKMLLRTSKSQCRSLAVVVRIIMFFSIPFIYYAVSSGEDRAFKPAGKLSNRPLSTSNRPLSLNHHY